MQVSYTGVIVAILLQRQELRLQRKELALTREELAKLTEAQKASGSMLGEQAEVMKFTTHLNALIAITKIQSEQINSEINILEHTDRQELIQSRNDSVNELT